MSTHETWNQTPKPLFNLHWVWPWWVNDSAIITHSTVQAKHSPAVQPTKLSFSFMHRWHYRCLSCLSEEQDSPLQLFHVPKQNLCLLLIITVQTSAKQHSVNSQYVSKLPLLMRSAGFILSTYMYVYIYLAHCLSIKTSSIHIQQTFGSGVRKCWYNFHLTPLFPLRQTNKQ